MRKAHREKQSCYRGAVSWSRFVIDGVGGQRGGFGSKGTGVND